MLTKPPVPQEVLVSYSLQRPVVKENIKIHQNEFLHSLNHIVNMIKLIKHLFQNVYAANGPLWKRQLVRPLLSDILERKNLTLPWKPLLPGKEQKGTDCVRGE